MRNAALLFPIGFVVGALLMSGSCSVRTHAHEWAGDAGTQAWFESRVQPDAPAGYSIEWKLANGWSCCGEADSYWADDFEQTPDGNYVAIITDGRDDKRPDGRIRQHRLPGTRIVVPKSKIAREGNPTGHGIIFMPVTGEGHEVIGYNGGV